MDRDQERFYQDDEQDIRANDSVQDQSNDEVNDMRYFLELLRIMRDGLNAGTSVPLTGKRLVDVDKLLLVLDDLEKNLPDAVQYGLQMYSEKDRFMSEAKEKAMDHITSAEMRVNAALERARKDAEQRVREAENEAREILEDAQERADRMLDESEILRQAREEARIMKNDARVEVSEMRLKAQHDAYQLLASVEDQLTEACKNIRRRRTELGNEAE
ncbi:MAG: ATP synthase F0 subunit B [Clostridia bacterium]|nr:ATP synthase F0 subunit B [Clostridia bacterium]